MVLTPDCGWLTYVNAGKSESKGFELEGTALLNRHWTVNFGFSHTNVELAEDHKSLGNKGDPLPGTSEYLISVGPEYGFQLFDRNAFARLDWSYVDEYYNNFAQTGDALGGYHEVDLTVGINIKQLELQLFVKNATDSNKVLWEDTEIGDGRVYRQRPRTIGLRALYRF